MRSAKQPNLQENPVNNLKNLHIPIDAILQGDSLAVLKTLPDNSVHCCVTSPPYYALRDYGVEGQIGREAMLLQKTYRLDHISKKVMVNRGEKRKYFVENSHEPIIDKDTFAKVQQELARRAEKFQPNAPFSSEYPFTGLIRCGFCGGYFRRKIANAGSKYAKPVWICNTFNTYGKDICSAQQIPEKILIEKTSEVLGTAGWDRETLLSYISEIWVPEHNLLMYVFRDGSTEEVAWQNPSRRESWSDEMKQTARERQLRMIERRCKDDGTD